MKPKGTLVVSCIPTAEIGHCHIILLYKNKCRLLKIFSIFVMNIRLPTFSIRRDVRRSEMIVFIALKSHTHSAKLRGIVSSGK